MIDPSFRAAPYDNVAGLDLSPGRLQAGPPILDPGSTEDYGNDPKYGGEMSPTDPG